LTEIDLSIERKRMLQQSEKANNTA